MTTATNVATVQVYRVWIKATPQAIWDAITKPEWSERYGFGGRVEIDLRPGGMYRVPTTDAMHAAAATTPMTSRLLPWACSKTLWKRPSSGYTANE